MLSEYITYDMYILWSEEKLWENKLMKKIEWKQIIIYSNKVPYIHQWLL